MNSTAPEAEVGKLRGHRNLMPPFGKGRNSAASWAAPAAVALSAIFVYLSSIGNGFAYDDIPVILENPAVHHLLNPLPIWLTPYWPGPNALDRGLYRPLTIFLFALQWAVGGGSPLLFHLMNVLLHSVASVLVFFLIKGLVEWRGALGAALLFAVHPVHVEAVANAVGQAELVSSCLVLMATILYVRRPFEGEVKGSHRRIIAGLFLAGLLAKENAIILPALLLALDIGQKRVQRPGYLQSVVKLGVLLCGVTGVYLVLRSIILGGPLSGNAALSLPFLRDPETRLLTALSVWPQYLRLMVVPFQLSAMYDPATIVPLDVITLSVATGSALLLLTVVGVTLSSAWPAIGLGSAWFLATILPVSNLLFPIGTVLGERTLYLPSVALAIWLGFGLHWALNAGITPRRLRPAVIGALGIGLVVFGIRTSLRNPVWFDNDTLLEATFRVHPENFRAQWFHAQRLLERGDSVESGQHWRKAFEIYPDDSTFLASFAGFLLRTGKLQEADDMVNRALELHPTGPQELFVQGLIDAALGRESRARERVESLVELGFSGMGEELADSLDVILLRITPEPPSLRE